MNNSRGYNLLDHVRFLQKKLRAVLEESKLAESKHEEEMIRIQRCFNSPPQEFDGSQGHPHQERIKEETLEDRIKKLELELEAEKYRQNKDEGDLKQLKKQNEKMNKQAALGWMLGCLSEIYLQEESKDGAVSLLIKKMMRNIQGEIERENVVLCHSGGSPLLQLEHMESEIRRLINCARLVGRDAQASSSIKDLRDDKVATTNLMEKKFEGFDANPSVDAEQVEVSGSTWTDVKEMNTNDNILHDHTDIKVMLSKLQAALDQHLATQAKDATSQPRSLAKLLNQPNQTSSPRNISGQHIKPKRQR